MRIAIFQDYLENIGGAEKLVVTLAKELEATIITTNLSQEVVEALEAQNVRFIDLGKCPNKIFLKHSLAVWKFFSCDFSKEFDFFIFSGNRSIFASWRHRPNIWYCHSPERAIFDLHDFYRSEMGFFRGAFFW
ncbi:MAG: glycosyltransferase family 4 protein, partial [archaeon]|nr:glycosyltransferase family 4 protein [archaeon]